MKPSVTLHHGDSRDILRGMIERGEKVHSVVCDPPYHLESIVKRFGKPGSAPAKHGTDGAFARQSRGFMGKTWDGADPDGSRIAQDPEFWALVWEVLLPGGFIIAFSSSRTYGWMQVAMEQAGFVTHPMIGWIQGQGFPKAHNASKAIDQQLGAERKVIGTVKRRDIRNSPGEDHGVRSMSASARQSGPEYIDHAITEAGSPEAAAWEGWAYGLQTLKPSLEPIYVGQKPFSEKNGALNLLKHGVGAMNIDGCRVATDETITNHSRGAESAESKGIFGNSSAQETHQTSGQALGRHPANVLHDGSVAVVECFPTEAGAAAPVTKRGADKERQTYGSFGGNEDPTASTFRGDRGSAARFFNALPFSQGDEPPFIYHPKATKSDRVVGCSVCGARALRDPGCDCRDPGNPEKPAKRIAHPTVKPVNLMRWLQRLVTPAGGTTLDPFAGSGTSGSAAVAEGFNVVLIEREDEYVADIRARLGLAPPIEDLLDQDDDFLALPDPAPRVAPTFALDPDLLELLG